MTMPCIIIGGDQSARIVHVRKQVSDVLVADQYILVEHIGIAQIRSLVAMLSLHPYGDRRLVYLEGSALTIPAQHALLKYLEEIPKHTHLFIGSNNANTLLDTIASRCITLMLTTQEPSPGAAIGECTDYPSLVRAQRTALKMALAYNDREHIYTALGRLKRACRASRFSLVSMPYELIADYVFGVVVH